MKPVSLYFSWFLGLQAKQWLPLVSNSVVLAEGFTKIFLMFLASKSFFQISHLSNRFEIF